MTQTEPMPAIITIDGPAGTGKSSVAFRLAERLGLEFLDTGAMYRAAALLVLEQSINPEDGATIAAAVEENGMHFDWTTDPPTLYLGERDVTARIRDLDVAGMVSRVAAQPTVRRVLVEWQRRISRKHPRLVTEGRDQGSVVFPDAPVRFFLDADIQVRAKRRARQLELRGQTVEYDQIVINLSERDTIDSSRSDGPLVCPEGATVVNTSNLSLDMVVDELERFARQALPAAVLRQ